MIYPQDSRGHLQKHTDIDTALAGALSLTTLATTDADPASAFRVQQDARLSATYVSLAQAAKNPDLLIVGSLSRNASDVITSAAVVWGDGTPGTFTTDAIDASGAINAYHITYGSPVTKTFTQPAMTRNANGAVTALPQIVVS